MHLVLKFGGFAGAIDDRLERYDVFMKATLIGFFLILCSFAADDSWTKVKALKSGTEIRIFQTGVKNPLIGKIDEADNERIVLVLKNEQKSVAKADIERLEARPSGGSRITRTKTVKSEDPSAELAKPSPPIPGSSAVPALSSSSSSVGFSSKPGFELVYRKAM